MQRVSRDNDPQPCRTRVSRDLPRRRYYTTDEVAWLTRMPERVVRENIMLSRFRS